MATHAIGLKTHIYNNNLKSAVLLAGFPVLVFGMVFAFYTALYHSGIVLTHMHMMPDMHMLGQNAGVDQTISAAFKSTLGALPFIISGVGIWFLIAYTFHSRMIRAATGAVPVSRKEYPKIYNMLENLCIARGIPMPQFQIIDSPALNAFASGLNQKNYCITLTRGIIQGLEDDELEAVIAHELSHIINRDVRLLIISVIFVGIFSFLAEMAFRSMRYGGRIRAVRYPRRSNNRGGGGIILIIALVILGIGYALALLIRFAISRKREYLADAGAVELTKNPEAMMRALMRISDRDLVKDMPIDVQQMCIENSHEFMSVFATHPPIEDRIKTISKMTSTPIPDLTVTLKRPPRRPWDRAQ